MITGNKGFSLIEVLVAIVILSVGLLGVAGLQGTAITGNHHGNTISQATVLAESQIEEIMNTDYSLVNNTTFPTPVNNLGKYANFTRTTQIENDVPLAELKRITVTVSWTEGTVRQIVLRTIISDEG